MKVLHTSRFWIFLYEIGYRALRLLLPFRLPKEGDIVIYVSCSCDTGLVGTFDRGVVLLESDSWYSMQWCYPAYAWTEEYPHYVRNEDADVSFFQKDDLLKNKCLRVIGSCLK
jgi:hypothetical protein